MYSWTLELSMLAFLTATVGNLNELTSEDSSDFVPSTVNGVAVVGAVAEAVAEAAVGVAEGAADLPPKENAGVLDATVLEADALELEALAPKENG